MNEQTSTGAGASPYRVLARKYRPQRFEDLIGQEPMVRTLRNAFATGRIAQAFLLTGVRGVGKTTTARILARALNYTRQGLDRPSVDFSELGEHCAAIMEGRHIDVIEMDAASHTGIGDVREIIEAVRYKPALARYKVYIIDEVHMLSNQAFNGLLKTLEEPPEHVKFVFATTEIRKVPVTVLSRCQRFDLRRIESDRLAGLIRDITIKESVEIEPDAVAMIARAAEGSARDALSLLDQAIAHGSESANGSMPQVRADEVRAMLGLADRARTIDLFEQTMRGEAAAALATLKDLHDSGADPLLVLQDLANFTHIVTRMKTVAEAADDPALTEEERRRGSALAGSLSIRVLSRAWQMLLKGIEEATEASRPLAAADMVLVRLAHAAELPTPDEALKMLVERGTDGSPVRSGATASAPARQPVASGDARPMAGDRPPARAMRPTAVAAAPRRDEQPAMERQPVAADAPMLARFEDVVALAAAKRDLQLKTALERDVRLVRFEQGRIEISPTEHANATLATDLSRRLAEWTGQRWLVTLGRSAEPTIHEKRTADRAQLETDARADPVVAAVMRQFPGAEIVDIRLRPKAEMILEPPPALPSPDEPEDN